MRKNSATGLIVGSIVGAAGLAWAVADKSSKRKLMSKSSGAIKKASRLIDDLY